ncbi:MAG TPA: hypothetical protein VGP62_11560 [Bryobacteraceae bacterium]|nr:hypothetical protein [Bryobacteraceae bacterium]
MRSHGKYRCASFRSRLGMNASATEPRLGGTVAATLMFLMALAAPAANFTYHIAGDDPGAWPQILGSIGLTAAAGGPANLVVVRNVAPGSVPQWMQRIQEGEMVVLEGESELAQALGFEAGKKHIVVRSIVDEHAPKLSIVWQTGVDIPVFRVPKDARVFATERWEGAPLEAAVRRGSGVALWIAVQPGSQGYERFPYLLQALSDLGMNAPFRSERLWAFFDGSYRSRVDLDYFADRWRKAGIGALHVAGWHYYESDAANDEYLRRLIEACHRKAILVYVWLELPHVSEKFWADHPEWREKTAILQDAQLDWRKLMNLTNRQGFAAVSKGVESLITRFDWDGVNLAELYFESLEGAGNPARFTPMNADVRDEFRAMHGFDPLELFQSGKPDPVRLRTFLDYRAELARRQQEEWIAKIEAVRESRPNLDFVLTHVDDRFDTRMRDLIGADAARVLPLLDKHDFTFLIEDPATIWNLGPERYPKIAEKYQPLTKQTGKLAIDINIVERYQDVYPTKQQTGTELFELVHVAAKAFPRVTLYFENSILAPDLPLLASAAASVDKVQQDGRRLIVNSRYGVGVPWQGPAIVNGRLWPVHDQTTLWVPAGPNVIEPAPKDPAMRMLDFNGDLRSANVSAGGLEFSYQSNARAAAVLNMRPGKLEVDGSATNQTILESGPNYVVLLPRGQHVVAISSTP